MRGHHQAADQGITAATTISRTRRTPWSTAMGPSENWVWGSGFHLSRLPSQVAADLYCVAELGFQDGVQVNCINPGPVRTARFEKRLAMTAAEHGVDRETALGIFVREEKITQVGEPEDVAGLVAFLLSKHGRYVHGSLIDADGGSTKTV